MATNVDTELNEFPINDVASDEVLKQMEAEGLPPHQLYFTPDEDNGLVADQITAGVTLTNQNDTVVECYVSSDGNTWYRKWASGWKECGGKVTTSSTSSAVTINLPVIFTNSNFIVVMNKGFLGTANALIGDISVTETYSDGSTTSYFQTRGYNSPVRYYACGY